MKESNPTAMISVNSSQLSYIGYDEDRAELFVTFKNNVTYKYSDVPKMQFTKLRDSSSVGVYYNTNIKGKFESVKIN